MKRQSTKSKTILLMLEEHEAYGQCINILTLLMPPRYHKGRGVSVARDDLREQQDNVAREITLKVEHLVAEEATHKGVLKELFMHRDFHTFALWHLQTQIPDAMSHIERSGV